MAIRNNVRNFANVNIKTFTIMSQKEKEKDLKGYKLLGESGLWADEEGNVYSPEELFGKSETEPIEFDYQKKYKSLAGISELDDKGNPAYWYYMYDERYCGPDRQAYMEEMALRYRQGKLSEDKERKPKPKQEQQVSQELKQQSKPADTTPSNENSPSFSNQAHEWAYREQLEVERLGLHPTFKKPYIAVQGINFTGIEDKYGHMIVSDKDYYNVGIYMNGLARAHSRKTGKFGFIDRHGKEVIPCVWKSAGEFSEYLVCVMDDARRCGYIDVTGRVVIPFKWQDGWPFHEGLARVQDNGKLGVIDTSGRLVVPCIWSRMCNYYSDGLIGVVDDSGKAGFMNREGEVVIPCQWKNVWNFADGLAVVQDFNKRLGFINVYGDLVIPCIWKKVNYFQNGLAKVSKSKTFFLKDKWVYIDKQGRIVKEE